MIAIIDYGTGNIFSLTSAVERCGGEYIVTSSPEQILSASSVIMPGVGAAGQAMKALRSRGLDKIIPLVRVPLLGICIGMQLLCSSSEEGDSPGASLSVANPNESNSQGKVNTECLGIFPNKVKKFSAAGLKIPHMGWNSLNNLKTPLFEGIEDGEYFYFVHSYCPEKGEFTIASTFYGQEFSSALCRDNFYGTQFHPEKSGAAGERVLRNFINLQPE
jgi:glutamine amidotransferase